MTRQFLINNDKDKVELQSVKTNSFIKGIKVAEYNSYNNNFRIVTEIKVSFKVLKQLTMNPDLINVICDKDDYVIFNCVSYVDVDKINGALMTNHLLMEVDVDSIHPANMLNDNEYSILNLLTIETVNIKLYEYIDQQFHDEQPLKVTFS